VLFFVILLTVLVILYDLSLLLELGIISLKHLRILKETQSF